MIGQVGRKRQVCGRQRVIGSVWGKGAVFWEKKFKKPLNFQKQMYFEFSEFEADF